MFAALGLWVQADQGARLQHLYTLFGEHDFIWCASPQLLSGPVQPNGNISVCQAAHVFLSLAHVQAMLNAVEHRPGGLTRLKFQAWPAVRCVRLGLMDMQQLHEMDGHPLMSACPKTMKLVAFGYLSVCYGCNMPGELSAAMIHSKRPRIAISAEALKLLLKSGARRSSGNPVE